MSFTVTELERLSFQSMRHQLVIVDQHWNIRSCNEAWLQDLGRHRNGPTPHTSTSRMHPEKLPHYLQWLRSWVPQEESIRMTAIIRHLQHIRQPAESSIAYEIPVHQDAKKRWFRMELTPLIQTPVSHCLDLSLIAHTDITGHKQTELQLKQALAEVRTLRGMLPICAVCKHIKDDQDQWNSIESYLEKHTHAEFTHDICPDCIRRLYPEYTNRLNRLS